MNISKTQPKVEKNVSRETLSNTTWGLVQDVATSEIKANGKMLYIFRNFLKMYKEKQLPLINILMKLKMINQLKKYYLMLIKLEKH